MTPGFWNAPEMSFYLNLFKLEPSYFSLSGSDLPGMQIDQPSIESSRIWFDFRQNFKKRLFQIIYCVQRRSDMCVGAHKGRKRIPVLQELELQVDVCV